MAEDTAELSPLEYATEITVAWLSNPNTRASVEDVPAFLQAMHNAVLKLNSVEAPQEPTEPAQEYTPAVTVRKSLGSPDHIISLVDGKPYKTLKRHLSTHGLTPAQYRERYGLKADYPMVAPVYAETRRQLAKKIGLGRKPSQKPGQTKAVAPAEPAARANPTTSAKPAAAAKPAVRAKKAAPAKTAMPAEGAAPVKPGRRKKLGVQFGEKRAAAAIEA